MSEHVITENQLSHYINSIVIVEFIINHSLLHWHEATEYVRNSGICPKGGKNFWNRSVVFDDAMYTSMDHEAITWLQKFYDAHPFLDRITIVETL